MARPLCPEKGLWIIAYYLTKLPSFWLTNPTWPASKTRCRMIRQHRQLPPECVGEGKGFALIFRENREGHGGDRLEDNRAAAVF
jgi:hypothetical protein